VVAAGDDVGAWQGMVSALRKLLVPALPSENLRWVQAEDLWHEARILIADLAERAQAQHRLHGERLTRALTESGATLLATQQIPALTGAVERQLPQLGLPGGWMALRTVDGEATAAPPGEVRLILSYDVARSGNGVPGAPPAPVPETTVETHALLRRATGALGRRSSVVVEPLYFHNQALGYLLLEMGPREGIVYESLAEQVSSALEGARLVTRLVEEATRRQAAERERLAKEMEIAARIQTSILPRDVTVAGLEIAASMQPATEVGGDYYDIVPVDDGCWIGIGDVAGHGLPTGLVMLMMQSGFGALARKLPDAAPRDLVLALNTMLVENVRARLGQHEHATLTLLRYRRDGSLAFAGAHEEILIRRAATGRCERIETPGPWVGAKRDISAGTVDSAAQLLPGDLLVLYTDGLTEAAADDGSGARFGSDRLVRLIEERGGEAPTVVRDAILAAVAAFTPRREDDVTLLVARYGG
jgi:serine phosphatase RsbU (regulator of sigma subunit)